MNRIDTFLSKEMPTRTGLCARHGEYESRLYLGCIWSKCPECVREDLAREQAKKEADTRKARRIAWEAKIGAAGIPVRFRTRTLDTFVAETAAQKRALEFARDYAYNFAEVLKTGRSALFVGRPGTGKTHLAVGIGLHIMEAEDRTVLFTTAMRAIRRVKDTWSSGALETESQAVARLASPDLLILDEVGVQFGSVCERNILFDILNERYENRLPTILLSNLTVDELIGFLGERVFDRLREDGGELIPFDWESYRGKSKAADE